jgi:hypothetical protein
MRGLGGATAIGKRRGGAAIRGSADWGEEEEVGIASFVPRSRFSPRSKKKATQMSRLIASIHRSRSYLAPFVIDLNGEAAGNNKFGHI